MIRTVIDTNVFVSSFRGGNPERVVDLWMQSKITLCLSVDILEEYRRVLAIVDLSRENSATLLAILDSGHSLVFTSRTPAIAVVEADPDDDKFFACALASGCDCIVSGDKHLLRASGYGGIEVLRPRRFTELHL